jgi:hypothetical protein
MDRSFPRTWGAHAGVLRIAAISAATVLALTSTGCGGTGSRQAASNTLIKVTERNFHVAIPGGIVRPGTVTMRILNAGPDRHELIVLPLRQGESIGGLPLRTDGFTVDEERVQAQEPGAISPQQPGHSEDVTIHLSSGRYVLFCNMEGHYMAGMHAELDVAQ